MPTRNLDLTEHFDRCIDDDINSGRFNSVSKVVHEGLPLGQAVQQRETYKAPLRAAFARQTAPAD